MSSTALNAAQSLDLGSIATEWYLACRLNYTRDTWVKLLQAPSPYAEDEAKLLCQHSAQTWVAWVPGHGEVVIDRSHFYI
jgi:hypothetical protein